MTNLIPIPGNYEVKIVQSGSMEPKIKTGSIVVIKPDDSYGVGDIITFGKDTRRDVPTTHRIVSDKVESGVFVYTTKGDANEDTDPHEVRKSEVIGKVVFSVPYVGYLLDFARKPIGFILLIVFPAGVVVFDEVMSIWREVKKKKKGFLISKGKLGKHNVALIFPELFMNKSGVAIKPLITSKKKAERLVVVYDDIDLGFGDYKVSFGRSSGGHRGIESIIKSIKTKDFVRVRVGIAPTTPSGKIRKPKGEKKVLDFLMGNFGKKEINIIPKISKTINEILETIIEDGRVSAMNTYN